MSQLSKNPLLVRCYGAIDPSSSDCITIDGIDGKFRYRITNESDFDGGDRIIFSNMTGIVMGEFLIPVFIALCSQA